MQRKRSYVEAMEAGSFQHLLETRNGGVADNANNINVSGHDNGDKIIKQKVGKTKSDQENNNIVKYDADDSASDGSVFESNDIDLRSKSQDFDVYNSSGRNTVVSLKRDYVSDSDMNANNDNAGQLGTIVDYKKNSEISENSNASRGLSIVDELINEPLTTPFGNSQIINRRSMYNENQNENNDAQILNNQSRTDYDSIQIDNSTEMENITLRHSHYYPKRRENNFHEEEPPFYEDGELNYDSDDMILDFDETEGERGHPRVNSLIIPNTVTSEENSILPILYTGRNSTRKSRKKPENCGNRAKRMKRLVYRNGETNIPLRHNIPSKMGKFLKDIVTTLIDSQWRWITLIVSMGHFLLWFIFGLMFYVASYSNGDISDNPPKIPCIVNGNTFTAIFAFSVESQVSIGYGAKSPTEECPEVIFILVMEVIAGNALLGALVGIVYAKIARPEKKIEGVGFSKHAVICMRDGQLCLVVRIWDTHGKHVIGTRVSAYLVNHNIPNTVPLKLEQPNPIIMWPTTIQHNIVEGSPLYDTSAKDLLDQRFEVVISITGSSTDTGQMAQSKTSYLPHNILWGQRFQNPLSYNKEKGSYIVDRKFLNSVKAVDTPLCSARLLDQVTEQGPCSPFFISTPSSPSILTSPGWSFRGEYSPMVINRGFFSS